MAKSKKPDDPVAKGTGRDLRFFAKQIRQIDPSLLHNAIEGAARFSSKPLGVEPVHGGGVPLHQPDMKQAAHKEAEKLLASGVIEKRHGSKTKLVERMREDSRFAKYRPDTLRRYTASAHAKWWKQDGK